MFGRFCEGQRLTLSRMATRGSERVGDGYNLWFNEGQAFIPFPEVWFDLDCGLAASRAAAGEDTAVICTAGVFTGILARHPDLKVVHTHVGGFIPLQAGRIDKNARIEGLPELPSRYLRQIYTDTVAPQAAGLVRAALDFYGPDHVVYGTDYPCWSPQHAVDLVGELGLSGPHRQQLMAGNARHAFPLH